MRFFAFLALLAASTSVDLVDENYEIAHSEWKYVEVNLRQKPALVTANFRVDSGSNKVRMALLTRANLENLRDELPHGVLAVTQSGRQGGFSFRVRQPGDYVIVVDNRASEAQAANVHLHISLDFADQGIPIVTGISRPRQFAVIAASFLFFFGIVTFAARRLMAAIKR
ncbi:MAG: hypothetical protein ABI759_02040 [Candidatus Solibacter sp.]